MITSDQQILLSVLWATLLLISFGFMRLTSRHPVETPSAKPLFRAFGFLFLLAGYYWIFPKVVLLLSTPWLIGYFGCLSLYLFFESLDILWWLIGRISGFWVPSLLDKIFSTRTIPEFWAYRWNSVVNSWFREISLSQRRRRPLLTVWLIYLGSGVWHEMLVNVPFFLITGKSFLGGMVIYFQIQWLGSIAQRRFSFLKNRLVTWIVIILPSPWVFNEATLRGLWLWR